MNDIKDKEKLPMVPLATFLLSRASGWTDGWTDKGKCKCPRPYSGGTKNCILRKILSSRGDKSENIVARVMNLVT
jgi:hypothetical protein